MKNEQAIREAVRQAIRETAEYGDTDSGLDHPQSVKDPDKKDVHNIDAYGPVTEGDDTGPHKPRSMQENKDIELQKKIEKKNELFAPLNKEHLSKQRDERYKELLARFTGKKGRK